MNGKYREIAMLIGDGDAIGNDGLQYLNHLCGVGCIRNQEHIVWTVEVGDQVIDHATGFIAQQGVLRLSRGNAIEVIGEH